MKRMLLSVGLAFATSLAAQAQSSSSPAAMLGAPRASLGAPIPIRDGATEIVPAFAQSVQPLPLGAPMPKDLQPPLLKQIADPKIMPSGPSIDEGKKDPVPEPIGGGAGAPITSAPALPPNVEEGMFPLPQNATPFINNRFRLSAEYLMWWTNGFSAPPLLTSGPAASNGFIGQPGVGVIAGNKTLSPNFYNGLRTGFEYWFSPCQIWGLDAHWWYLGQQGNSFGFLSSNAGSPLLARPFYNLNTGTSSAELVASPGLFAGGVAIGASTSLWGADVNLRRRLCQGCTSYLDGLIGYRFVNLNEQLTITEQSSRLTAVAPNPADPSTLIVSGQAFDRFTTSNQFNGAQIGTAMGCVKGRWTLDFRSTVALGTTSSTLQIDGAHSTVDVNGVRSVGPGGLYALSSNIGHHYRDSFAIVPEATFNIGYNVSQHCRLFVGYNALYWSSVLRPGDQVDLGIDQNRIPNFPASPNTLTTARPAVPNMGRDLFVQGH